MPYFLFYYYYQFIIYSTSGLLMALMLVSRALR